MSLPPREVYCIRQHMGSELGFTSSQITAATFNIATFEGKLHELIQKKSSEIGEDATIEALLDACHRISPALINDVLKEPVKPK